jgi:uncharacterized protein YecT (DUF1311 family)
MRLAIAISVLTVLTTVLPCIAFAQANDEAEKACSEGVGPQAAVYACLYRKAKDSEKQVALAESEAIAALNAWDMDDEYRHRALTMFTDASKAFRGWRATQCNAVASLAAGGNGDDYFRDSCEIELNRNRLQQIASYLRILRR